MPTYKTGDIVTIYEHPWAEEKPEGKAKLIRKISEDQYFEVWEVKFLDSKDVVPRKIRKPDFRLGPRQKKK